MKVGEFYSRRLSTFALTLLVGFVALAVESNAQATRTLNNVSRRMDDFNKQNTKAELDELNNELRGKKQPSAEELKRAAALKAQLKEDLETLQNEYNELVTKLKASEAISVKVAAEVGERVHLRAERLLKNLNLPAPKPSETLEPKTYGNDTKRLIRSMCSLIFEFVTDSIFESPSAIDVESGGKARSTLEELVRLSDHIRRRS